MPQEIKPMTILGGESLLQALNNAKQEVRNGLCIKFSFRLERLAAHIRSHQLTATESAELLEHEVMRIQQENNGDHD